MPTLTTSVVLITLPCLLASGPSVPGQQAVLTLSSADATPLQRDEAEAFILTEKSAELLPLLFDSLDDPVPGDLPVETLYYHGGHALMGWQESDPPRTAQDILADPRWTLGGWIVAHRVRVWKKLAQTAEPVERRYEVLREISTNSLGRCQQHELTFAWERNLRDTEEELPAIETAMRAVLSDPTMSPSFRQGCLLMLTPSGRARERRDRHFEFAIRILWSERSVPIVWWNAGNLFSLGRTKGLDGQWTPTFDPRVMTLMVDALRRSEASGIPINDFYWQVGVVLGVQLPEGFVQSNEEAMRGPRNEQAVSAINAWIEANGAQIEAQAQAMNNAGNP